jgi:hypothetical protein
LTLFTNTRKVVTLILHVEAVFTIPNRIYSSEHPLRPSINFGDGLLFSGEIVGDFDLYMPNIRYPVYIDMFTMNEEGLSMISHLLHRGMILFMQSGSRIVGYAVLLDYVL